MPADHDSLDHLRTKKARMPKPKTKKPLTSYGTGLVPTRKWWAATVVGAGTIGTGWAEAGHWSHTLTVAAVGFAVQRLVAWLVPNAEG